MESKITELPAADLILVDSNSIGYTSAFSSTEKLIEFDGQKICAGIIFEFTKRILEKITQNPESSLLLLWDSDTNWRHEIYPEYKGQRDTSGTENFQKRRAQYKEAAPVIQTLLSLIGVRQLKAKGFEADDLAGLICNANQSKIIELWSKDTDWIQGVGAKCRWVSVAKNSKGIQPEGYHKELQSGELVITEEDLAPFSQEGLEEPFYLGSGQEYIQCKALVGDTADNIPGLRGVGFKTAYKWMTEHSGLDNFFELLVHSPESLNLGKKFESLNALNSRDLFKRNMKLMSWTQIPKLNKLSLEVDGLEFDLKMVVNYLKVLDLMKLAPLLKKVETAQRRRAFNKSQILDLFSGCSIN